MEEYLHDKAIDLVYSTLEPGSCNLRLVWFCKTLQNWKAMIADINGIGTYFEITYNGDKKEAYVDRYEKAKNTKLKNV